MKPGNGIETPECGRVIHPCTPFKLMKPGNGIETGNSQVSGSSGFIPFKLMKPGNGIETISPTSSS